MATINIGASNADDAFYRCVLALVGGHLAPRPPLSPHLGRRARHAW